MHDVAAEPSKAKLPGTKAKQARALAENVRWMAEQFGEERIGFLTLTCGDYKEKKFEKVHDRKEASRRFNSLCTGILRKRYRCGVVVVEPHKDGGLHFHLVAVMPEDIRTGFDFNQFKRLESEVQTGTRKRWRARETGANEALAAEWAFWRRTAPKYGFGRCNLQPIKKSGEAVGNYVSKYISKGFEHRKPEDRGARNVRYFGHWDKQERRVVAGLKLSPQRKPRWSGRHGSLSEQARAWRECCRQIALVGKMNFIELDEWNVTEYSGKRWAWHWTERMRHTKFLVPDCVVDAPPSALKSTRKGLEQHNREVEESQQLDHRGRVIELPHVWERSLLDWFDWKDETEAAEDEMAFLRWQDKVTGKAERENEEAFAATFDWGKSHDRN